MRFIYTNTDTLNLAKVNSEYLPHIDRKPYALYYTIRSYADFSIKKVVGRILFLILELLKKMLVIFYPEEFELHSSVW